VADLVDTYGIEVVQGDVQDAADVGRAVNGCETVIHLAAGAPHDWNGYQRLFVDGLANVAEAVRRHGTRRLFFASSIASLYLGNAGKHVTEDEPTDPRFEQRCHYARAKVLCEQLLDKLRADHNLPYVTFRPGIVIGEGSTPQHLGIGEWPSETMCIRWGRDLSAELPFVLVDDVVEAFLCAMAVDIDQIAGKKFNLVGDVRLSAREYIELLQAETFRDFRLVPQSITRWATIEWVKWFIKACARKPENTRLSWRELSYRTAASTLDCEQTKRVLRWQPTADRETFIERGIRAAVGEATSC
jgi:nucleoside-diphosphate-sugar epimerase